jgi:hypothetical protein
MHRPVLLQAPRSLGFALVLLMLPLAWAQSTGVKGIVRGPSGPVARATIWLSRPGGPEVMVKTDETGRFEATLPPGTYAMDVYAPQLVSVVRAAVQVNEGQWAEVATTLAAQRTSP